jgi:Holliday junction resolvasome RuvABC endonuclease subunit
VILAIDPSLTNTAVIVGHGVDYQLKTFGSKNQGDNVSGRIARYDALVGQVMDWIEDAEPIDAVFIEAYSYGSNDARAKFSAEYGGILRFHLVDLTQRIFEVAPMTLKKFCTGAGKGKKDMVAAHLTKRYGVMFNDNDSFDAFGLYQLGLVVEGVTPAATTAQAECAAKITGTPLKKAKKPKAAKIMFDDPF